MNFKNKIAFFSIRLGLYAGIAATTICTLWAVLTKGAKPLVDMAPYTYKWDDLMIGAVGNVLLIIIGYGASLLFGGRAADPRGTQALTLWDWLLRRPIKTPTQVSEVAKAYSRRYPTSED